MERLIEEFSLGDIGLQSVMPDYHRLDNLPVALYVTNAQGAIVYYNSAASKLWGRTPELYKEKWCGS